jgi:hypothetical protein
MDGIWRRGNIVTPDPTIHLHLPLEEYLTFILSEWTCSNSGLILFTVNPDMSSLAYLDDWAVWEIRLMGVPMCWRYEMLLLRRTEAVKMGLAASLAQRDWVLFPDGLGISDFFAELWFLKGGMLHWSVFKITSTIVHKQLCTRQRELFSFWLITSPFPIMQWANSMIHYKGFSLYCSFCLRPHPSCSPIRSSHRVWDMVTLQGNNVCQRSELNMKVVHKNLFHEVSYGILEH